MNSFSYSPRCGVCASTKHAARISVAPCRAVKGYCQQRDALLVAGISMPSLLSPRRRRCVSAFPVFVIAASASPKASSNERPPPSVGIDLGTSHSAIAVAPGGKPQLIRLLPENAARPFVSGGDNSASRAGVLLPSVVFYPGDAEGKKKPLVGTAALVAAAAAAPAAAAAGGSSASNLVLSSKRLMGKKAEEPPPSGSKRAAPPFLKIAVASREEPLLPQQVATEIIGALLDAAQAHFGGRRPARAVVSVPAYFSKEARAATEEAARGAGLETVRLVREPVAAALGYGLRPGAPRDETVLVVDLGGGTFDVSLLEVGGGAVEVLSTGGDASLGGDDWDAALAELIGSKFLLPAGITDWKSPKSSPAYSALLGAARAAKEALSAAPAVELTLAAGSGGTPPVVATVTRSMLDQVGEPLFARAAAAIDEACYQSGVEIGESIARWRESTARAEADAAAATAAEKAAAKGSRAGGAGAAATSSSSAFKLRPKRRPPVSRVLLVGGGTRMWGFDAFVENLTGLSPTKAKGGAERGEGGGSEGEGGNEGAKGGSALSLGTVDPDTSVAAGAALQAAMLDGDPALSGVVVLDVWQAGLARALAEARLAAEERREEAIERRGGEDDDDDDGDEFLDEDDLLEDGSWLVFSPPPPPLSKTKLRKQRARAAKRSNSAGGGAESAL